MSAIAQSSPLTYEEERGKPMPSLNHSFIQANLIGEFIRNGDYRVASELTLDLGQKPDATPDLCIFPRRPMNLLEDQIRSKDIPVMVVEILSPTQGSFEVLQRFQRYFANGVKSCWLVEPVVHSIMILTADGTETTVNEGIVTDPATGLTADLARVFS